ncbi:MAG: carboxypeptidase regulatory-like domain-containing protein, partial [Candidatus Methylomirabilota bacterium]
FAGPLPREEFQPVFKHREFCGERMPSNRLRVGADRGVADVLITLEGASALRGASPARSAVLDNRGCRFVPRVQVVPPGTRLEVRNSDPILHTVHAYLGSETLFHLALPVFRQRVWAILDRPGLIRIDCDVGHTWMRAYVLVRAHGLATVSGPDGAFHLTGVPPGTFSLRAWHESLGTRDASVTVVDGRPSVVTLLYGTPSD